MRALVVGGGAGVLRVCRGGSDGSLRGRHAPATSDIGVELGGPGEIDHDVGRPDREHHDVTWQKVENPDPDVAPVAAGTVMYTVSAGGVHVAYRATRTNTYTGVSCSDEGAVDVPLDPGNPLNLRPHIYLAQDGQYAGSIYGRVPLSISYACTNGSTGSSGGDVRIRLDIRGSVTADRRMRGEMVPETSVGETITGSWDFAAR
jgi:hypothetical protein